MALLYVHDTWMDIERNRVNTAPGIRPRPSARGELASDDYNEAYDDISRSDDVSEAIHAPRYQARQIRGETSRGSDRLNVSNSIQMNFRAIISYGPFSPIYGPRPGQFSN